MKEQDFGSAEENGKLSSDQFSLAEKAFPGYRPIFSETFTKKSGVTYGPEWLVREIVQNFVDANPHQQGTLNGVTCERTELGQNRVRYTIMGHWPFRDATGLRGLHTDKEDDKGIAGGNGIGLKQTALGFLRDHDVDEFSVIGEYWTVDYKMPSADEINCRLENQGESARVKVGFLLAGLFLNDNQGKCTYTIVVPENGVIDQQLSQFNAYGVCDSNPYLQNMDYRNSHGAIRWLAVQGNPVRDAINSAVNLFRRVPSQDEPRYERGRLFLNGQIYRFKRKGENDNTDYWDGPDGMTIQLNSVDYPMSIDRPPVDNDDLISMYRWDRGKKLMNEFFNAMSKEDLIEQLKASEHIWSTFPYKRFRHNPFVRDFIEVLCDMLQDKHFFSAEYKENFGEKKYYCAASGLTEEQAYKFEKDGYAVLPSFFSKIHMPETPIPPPQPKWDTSLDKPQLWELEERLEKESMERGIPVSYARLDIEEISVKSLGKALKRIFGNNITAELDEEYPSVVRIYFHKGDLRHLSLKELSNPGHEGNDRHFFFLKGFIFSGLNSIFQHAVLRSPCAQTTFGKTSGILMLKNKAKNHDGTTLEIQFLTDDNANNFLALLPRKQRPGGPIAIPIEEAGIIKSDWPDEEEQNEKEAILYSRRKTNAIRASIAASVLAVFGAGGWYFSRPKAPPKAITYAENIVKPKIDDVSPPLHSNSLEGLLEQHRTADIPKGPSIDESEDKEPSYYHNIAKFRPLEKISKEQRAQLELLREYFHLTTGHYVENQLFLFSGEGALGVNTPRRGIGLHHKVTEGPFEEAVATFTHEVAHNFSHSHRISFESMLETLFVVQEDTLGNIARIPNMQRSSHDERILKIEQEWDRLRTKMTK